MSAHFSHRDLAKLARANATLLAPLGEAAAEQPWRRVVHDAVRDLLDAACVNVLVSSGPSEGWYAPGLTAEGLAAYEREFGAQDRFVPRVLADRLRVAHQFMLVTPRELYASAFFHEWVRPHWPYTAPVMLSADVGAPVPAAVTVGCGAVGRDGRLDADASAAEWRVALLRAVWPAFEAGARAAWRLAGHRAALGRVLDALEEPLAVHDAGGRVLLHGNAALTALLDAIPAHAVVLRAAVAALARETAPLLREGATVAEPGLGARTVRVGGRAYRLRATLYAPGVLGPEPGVLVSVAPEAENALDDASLARRFGLTPRQAAVARLLGEGLDNATLSARLGVTPHTGRRHTEQVLAKLGARSRAQVTAVLRGGRLAS